jgi:ankyrin repeat protein
MAVRCQHTAVVKLLLEHSAAEVMNSRVWSPCVCCGCEQCPIVMACRDAATLKLLLTAGADVFATTESGSRRTPLHVAAAHGYPASVVCMLIKAGVDLHAVNSSGQTAAQLAREHGHALLASLLIRAAQDK